MRPSGTWGTLALALAAAPLSAQRGRVQVGVALAAVATDPIFAGLGPSIVAPLSSQIGLALTGTAGWRGSEPVGRLEVALRVEAPTSAEPRARWYLLGGVAAMTGRGAGEFVLLGLGFERGVRARWWGEAGLAGGVRLAVGRRYLLGRASRRGRGAAASA